MNEKHNLVLVGSIRAQGTLEIEEFLTRNRRGFLYIDWDKHVGLRPSNLLEEMLPVVLCNGETYARPTLAVVAEAIGLSTLPDAVQDVVVVGAGPAGLAGAIYAASEGLSTLIVESYAPGGQAGLSSRIENYMGFPDGLSGMDLASRALEQGEKFGAKLAVTREAVKVTHAGGRPYTVELDGAHVKARAILMATGARYNKLEIAKVYENGMGSYYSATPIEAQLVTSDEEVVVVGGGNSAGQAAAFLSSYAQRVHVLVRGAGLKSTMSAYLLDRLVANGKVTIHNHSQLETMAGTPHLESVTWVGDDGKVTLPIRHVFFMLGAHPNTGWLNDCCILDKDGFVVTGQDLTREQLLAKRWPIIRPPFTYETSLPGVFAVGDVRSGSIKRVASAVGEGSAAVQYIHKTLEE